MNKHQSHSQFRSPFTMETLYEGKLSQCDDTLQKQKNRVLPPHHITIRALPPRQSTPEHTKALVVIPPEQAKKSLITQASSQPTFLLRSIPSKRPEHRKTFMLITGVVVSLVLVVGYLLARNLFSATPDVTLYQVSKQNVIQYSGGGGIVFPRQKFTLSYPEPEYATNVLVKVGDQVSINQPLIKLDPTRLNAQVKQQADDVTAAQAYLNNVSASGNAESIAHAQQQYTLARNKYNALVAESSSLLLHDGNLISPMNGVVTDIEVNSGEIFAPDTPLIVIMDESMVIVHVKVPLANLSQTHAGEQAIVTPSALPDLNFQGTISSVVPQADPQTDTFEVWVNVPNPQNRLLPGMSAFVRIIAAQQSLVVPRLAILNPAEKPVTFVVHGQYAYLQPVHIETFIGDRALVREGLKAGDHVVLVGQIVLHNGQHIHVCSIEF